MLKIDRTGVGFVTLAIVLVVILSRGILYAASQEPASTGEIAAWKPFWAAAQERVYQNSLPESALTQVNACAKELKITPARVVLTLCYNPVGFTADRKGSEKFPQEYREQLQRIEAVVGYFAAYPEHQHFLVHATRGKQGKTSRETAEQIERLQDLCRPLP